MEWMKVSSIFTLCIIGSETSIGAEIISLWVPELMKNGSVEGAVLDCVYNYTDKEKDSLEVKWYFRHDPTPIYQWLPPQLPQVLSADFAKHVVPQFKIGNDPYTQYRALNLHSVDTTLSGQYSCRVSSNLQDSFQSKQMIVFAEPGSVEFSVETVKPPPQNSKHRWMNLTCSVSLAYPQPSAALKRTTEWGTIQDLSGWTQKVVTWFNGSYHLKSSIQLPIVNKEELLGGPYLLASDLLHCEVTLDSTPFKRLISKSLSSILGRYQTKGSLSGASKSVPNFVIFCTFYITFF